ncbi:hypothetical protein PACTADRAFT_34511 [Pachysolen tannophilus NRRL Y-2460]|uniref:UspA domain-containing protein n=1 Tax=Pachysolen tannophilus NRRL Y-2460 TaxID=669874 RepID=A0A1E4TSP5_PACTA|nr:hypothetical protein PACTADRAFT_34511 [Pachysolen tannophilus NRRL Y-2460]
MASLEATLNEENQAILRTNRGRSISPKLRARSRGRSENPDIRSTSRSRPQDFKFSITAHDPSERLRSPSRLREDSDSDKERNDDEDEEDDDDLSFEASEEEQITDSEKEFEFDECDGTLPNFTKPVSSSGKLKSFNSVDSTITAPSSNSDRLAVDARKAIELEQFEAANRAINNARETKSEIPVESLRQFNDAAADLGIVKLSGQLYQEPEDRREKLKSYAIYKKKIISPDSNNEYTSSVEEKMDSELAQELNETIVKSPIDSNIRNQRSIRTLTRGNFFEIVKKNKDFQPKTFLLCMDFSPESIYALEWCIGTILVDGSVLYIVNVLEDTEIASPTINGNHPHYKAPTATSSAVFVPKSQDREGIRNESVEYITNATIAKLKMTKLQVHVVIESIHHPIPRHFILEVIDHLTPNLVIVGSKGRSSLKGVLLGSLSNYIVTKSSVPVMVVRSKLKRITKKKKVFSNNLNPVHLTQARVD